MNNVNPILEILLSGVLGKNDSQSESPAQVLIEKMRAATKDILWPSGCGHMPISNMTDHHIINSMVMLHNKIKALKELGIPEQKLDDRLYSQWIDILRVERKVRLLIAKDLEMNEYAFERNLESAVGSDGIDRVIDAMGQAIQAHKEIHLKTSEIKKSSKEPVTQDPPEELVTQDPNVERVTQEFLRDVDQDKPEEDDGTPYPQYPSGEAAQEHVESGEITEASPDIDEDDDDLPF